VGAWAKGIPLKLSTLFEDDPTTVAAGFVMVTVGALALFSCAGAAKAAGRASRKYRVNCTNIILTEAERTLVRSPCSFLALQGTIW
jgi:hypothetical protein